MTNDNKAISTGINMASNTTKDVPIIKLFIQGYKLKNQGDKLLEQSASLLKQVVESCRNDDTWLLPTAMMLYSPPSCCSFASGTYSGICQTEHCSHWGPLLPVGNLGTCMLLPNEGIIEQMSTRGTRHE